VRAVPRLCGFTTEKKAWKTSVRVVIQKRTIRIHNHNNKNTYITLLNRNKTVYTLIKKIEPKECDNVYNDNICMVVIEWLFQNVPGSNAPLQDGTYG
jgi:hypothetical protein